MKKGIKYLRAAILCFAVMTLLCGVIYTAAVTGAAQLFFPEQANGSIVSITLKDGTVRKYGSELLAQEFTKAEYLIGRPSGVTNLSPTSEEQETLVKQRIAWWQSFDPSNKADIPMDLVTGSGSGVDPNISPQAAEYQVARISKARQISEDTVREIIHTYTSGRFLGFIGEPGVNVLKVNLALDGLL
ncbi:MAG: K(+)-transporting ATPase subunit C [Lachnospiraceae bacterium]